MRIAALFALSTGVLAASGSNPSSAQLASTVTAAERCMAEFYRLEQSLQRTSPMHITAREFRALRRAGDVLARNGNEAGCQRVLADTLRYFGDEAPPPAAYMPGKQFPPSPDLPSLQVAGRLFDYPAPLGVESLLGKSIRNLNGEQLAEVEDVILNPNGTVRYLLAQHHSMPGLDEPWAAVPWSVLRISVDGEDLIVPMTKAQFEAAPRASARAPEIPMSADWVDRNEAFFARELSQAAPDKKR